MMVHNWLGLFVLVPIALLAFAVLVLGHLLAAFLFDGTHGVLLA